MKVIWIWMGTSFFLTLSACHCDKDRRVPFYTAEANNTGESPVAATTPLGTDAGVSAVRATIQKTRDSWYGSTNTISLFADAKHGLLFPSGVVMAPDGSVAQKIFEWAVPIECVHDQIGFSVVPAQFISLETRWRCLPPDAGSTSAIEDHMWLLNPETGALFDEWSVATPSSMSASKAFFDIVPIDDPAYVAILRITARTAQGPGAEARIAWLKIGVGARRDGRDTVAKLHELALRAEKQLEQKPKQALKTATLAATLYDAVCRESRRAVITFESETEPGIICQNAEDAGRLFGVASISAFRTENLQNGLSFYRRFSDPSVMVPEHLRATANAYLSDAGPSAPPATIP